MKDVDKINWQLVENKLLGDEAVVEKVDGNHITVCRYNINKKVFIPMHSHQYEQTIYVLQGEMILTVEDKQIPMMPGDVYVLLGGIKHSAEIVVTPFQTIESYSPIRIDLVKKHDMSDK